MLKKTLYEKTVVKIASSHAEVLGDDIGFCRHREGPLSKRQQVMDGVEPHEAENEILCLTLYMAKKVFGQR